MENESTSFCVSIQKPPLMNRLGQPNLQKHPSEDHNKALSLFLSLSYIYIYTYMVKISFWGCSLCKPNHVYNNDNDDWIAIMNKLLVLKLIYPIQIIYRESSKRWEVSQHKSKYCRKFTNLHSRKTSRNLSMIEWLIIIEHYRGSPIICQYYLYHQVL